jgi:predicted DNA-binding transcriptional regulator YafY
MAQKQQGQKKQRLQIVHSFYVALTILDRLVQTPGSLTPEALAQELSEDETGIAPRAARSIRRYLKRFEELGFSFEQSAGVRGIHVPQAFRQKLHVLNFTEDELIALHFHLVLLGDMVQGSDLQVHLASVCQKIALGVGELYSLDALQRAFLPFQKWYKTYSSRAVQTKLALVVRALHESKVCQIRYRTPHANSDWTCCMHLYTLFEYEGGLYLFAYLPDDDRVVVLGIERIRYITVLEASFTKLPHIRQQIEAKRERAFGIIDDEEELNVVLQFTAEQAPYVRERVWHPSQGLQEQEDGSLILRFRASGQFEIVRWVLGWGEHVEVLEPLALRQEVAQHLLTAAKQYPYHMPISAAKTE